MKFMPPAVSALVMGICSVGFAQIAPLHQRKFTYTPQDASNFDFSRAEKVLLTSVANVSVQPFLYISGNLGMYWVVDGSGLGNDTEQTTILFYHNETIGFQFAGFDDAQKISGTATGAKKVPLSCQVRFYNDAKSALLFDSEMVSAVALNSVIQPSGPAFGANATSGLLRLVLSRKIVITPNVGPGQYQNIGTITVTRN